MTTPTATPPETPESPPVHGYVPAFATADGNEDPAPPAVTHSTAPQAGIGQASAAAVAADAANAPVATRPAPAGALSAQTDIDGDDGRYGIAEKVSADLQSEQARRVGQMPLDRAPGGVTLPDPTEAIAQSLQTPASQPAPAIEAGPGQSQTPGA